MNGFLHLLKNLLQYCEYKGIKLLVLGPAIRSYTMVEKELSQRLEEYIYYPILYRNIRYVYCLEDYDSYGNKYFCDKGIYAKEGYHKLIADRLYRIIKWELPVSNALRAST